MPAASWLAVRLQVAVAVIPEPVRPLVVQSVVAPFMIATVPVGNP